MKTITANNSQVKTFIKSLKLPYLAYAVLKTFDECQEFFRYYYMRNRYAIDDLMEYRIHKIKALNISLEEFLDMCNNEGIKYAFETTFLQPISSQQAKRFEEEIRKGTITLEYIYNSFQENYNKNILKYLV